MSELINNSRFRKDRLKELILKLHDGASADEVRRELKETLQSIPYGEVVEVEQELISEGLPDSEVLKLCDVHGEVLEGNIDVTAAAQIPEGHPVDVFINENKELLNVAKQAEELLRQFSTIQAGEFKLQLLKLVGTFNELSDVDKHYQRKEYLVFPYLEKNGITGPPKVMWGKHDEIREQVAGCLALFKDPDITLSDVADAAEILILPTLKALKDMVQKEEEILFPMCMDVLTTEDWWQIHKQTIEIGFTLYDPHVDWKPDGINEHVTDWATTNSTGQVQLPSGSFSAAEILAILNTLPVDMTFVDKNDKVKYFSQGAHRIFTRSRSIINRDVRLCHPPGSVHIVEKIIDDFKSGRASHAPFWIQMRGKFILIEYFALRDDKGEYLGTLEVSQDLTNARSLEGEKRILSYAQPKNEHHV